MAACVVTSGFADRCLIGLDVLRHMQAADGFTALHLAAARVEHTCAQGGAR